MGCQGEPEALDDETTAKRAAQLARVAEDTAARLSLPAPLYVIGTEVPPPGGADHALSAINPTGADAARQTLAVHARVFAAAGLQSAFDRAIGLVVQPGVEFGNHNVVTYRPDLARDLTSLLQEVPQIVFEAHSTDYQGTEPLADLVLKVGPELTFVLREALYALDLIASDLVPGYPARGLKAEMEALMCDEPGHWMRHYPGRPEDQAWLRHYSLSDRIRYYWPHPRAEAAVARLLDCLRDRVIPAPLLAQHLPAALDFADKPLDPEALLVWRINRSLASYHAAGTAWDAHQSSRRKT
jgi:D-tagatose 6-phosphate 4-epimerase